MKDADFRKCLALGEGTSIEFKRCGNVPGEDTFETICSFANRQGGSVFLGVEKDGTVIGVAENNIEGVERNIVNVINNPKMFNIPPAIELERIAHEGMTVIRAWVPISSIVHSFKNVVYDRIADVDIRVKTDAQLAAMYIRKQEYYSEQKIFPFLSEEDLRLDLIPRIRQMALAKRADHPWATMDDRELLKSANLHMKNYETGAEGYTLAAALILGKDDVIASIVPAYKTDAYVRRNDKDRYDDRLVVKTNLIEAYDQLLAFAQKHLPDKFFLEGTQSISLRDVIVRELVSNTLVHREYTSSYPAKLVIDADGLRTENANRPRFIGTLSPDGFNPQPKNPVIAEFFSNIGRAETLGSGTRNLFKYSWAYGGAHPVLEEDDVFKATVPLLTQAAGAPAQRDVDEVIAQMLESYGYVSVAAVASVAGVTQRTVRRHTSPMVERGELVAEGTTRDRRYVPVLKDAK